MPKYTEVSIADYLNAPKGGTINRTHRFYFIGRLVRQDLAGPEPGYRETLSCRHCDKPLQVIGPTHNSHNTFAARCINDKCPGSRWTYYGRTIGELWEATHPQQA